MLALLLGALFAAVPAEAQTTVWSATLTADESGSFFGCDNSDASQDDCSTATVLTDDDFVFGGSTYSIDAMYWQSSTNILTLKLISGDNNSISNSAAKAALGSLTLNVQGNAFSISNAGTAGGPNSLTWSYDPATDWTDGLEVSVSLTPTQSTDATLSALTATSSMSASGTFTALTLSPAFAAATTAYTATVGNSITHVKLTPTVNDSNATVKVGKGTSLTTVTSGSASTAIALSVGSNAITVRVTAQNGTTKDYTVNITRQAQQAIPTVSLSVSPNPVTEGSPVMVTATLSAALSSPVTIPVTVSTSGSNTAESADVGTLASISISSGQTTGTGTISTTRDADGDDETFTVSLGSSLPSSVTAGSPNSVQVTIREVVAGTPCSGTQLGQLKRKFGDFRFGGSSNVVNEGESVSVWATLREALTPPCVLSIPITAREPGLYQGRRAPSAAELAEDIELPLDPIVIRAGQTTGSSTIRTKRDDDYDDELFYVVLDEGALGVEVGGQHNDLPVQIRDGEYRPPTSRNPPADPPPDPDTEETDTGGSTPGGTPGGGGGTPSGGGGGGGGGSGGGGGGGGGPPAQSSDASLETLEIEEDSLDLDPQKDDYTRDAYGEKNLTLTPTASDSRARITVDGNSVRSGTPYTVTLEDDGETVIEIVVTAEDGTTRTYTLTVMSCPGEDRENLVRFYDATDGDNWDNNTDWNSEEPLDQWFGVDTDEDGEVLSLRLADNNLSGDMPTEELLCLNEDTELKELALWDNDGLSGEESDELALAVERAVLRDVAETLELNAQWFEDYEDPFNFSDWHGGVMTDDDGRVTGLDFTGEDITGEIPQSVFVLEKLTAINTGCKVTVDPVPERVRVTMPEGCSDASLQNIEISPGELEFDPMDFSYEVPVGYGPESVTVTPTASESEAVITVNGNTVQSGEDVEIELNEEEPSIVSIVVTAPDGMTTRTYGITVTRCGEDDMWALSRFYEAVGGENWNDNTNWNSQEPLDRWFGVGTDEDGRVISLDLEGNGLSGETPRELVCLSEIKELALWDNDSLSGKEPEELALAVERAVLRDVAEALELNAQWFDDYEDPFSFSDWHVGVTTDDDGRVTELDFTGEDITGVIPGSVFELKRLTAIETGCEVTLEIEAPGRVSVMPEDCPEETPPEDMEEMEEEEDETPTSGGGGCAVGQGGSSASGFGLFLVTILVFAALVRRRARG